MSNEILKSPTDHQFNDFTSEKHQIIPENTHPPTPEIKISFSNVTGPNFDGKMSYDEKALILQSQKLIYKQSKKERRVEAVRVHGAVFSSKGPFFSGWVAGVNGHWGVVVDDFLHHLVFTINSNGVINGVELEIIKMKEHWKATKEDIGSSTIPLLAVGAIGEALIIQFQDYRKLYRNCQTFAEIFVELICDIDCKPLASTSISKLITTTLIAFPLTTIGGSVVHLTLSKSKSNMIATTKENLSWEDLVDMDIKKLMEKTELNQEKPKKHSILSNFKNIFSKRQ